MDFPQVPLYRAISLLLFEYTQGEEQVASYRYKGQIVTLVMKHSFYKTYPGRVTLATLFIFAVVFSGALFSFFRVDVHTVSADDVTTSVTVLNTPPVWTVNAEEAAESSATTPTNSGSAISWTGTGTDSSGDDYFLLICKTGVAPTANANAPPTCDGGNANQWAISATTTSGVQATAATTTLEVFPFDAESNDWHGWICDANATLPRCNNTAQQGSGSTASPFVINHPPVFSGIVNNGPVNPGATITWTATSSDNDVLGSADTVQLFVCRANDFTGSFCGPGGSWATSTLSASNPATTTTIAIPTQDDSYDAYVFVIDNHGHAATSTIQATNSSFDVSNVAPAVTAATISLVDTDDVGNLELLNAAASTTNFKVQFEVTDDNSCQNAAAGDEITSIVSNVYRSGVTQASCQLSGEYNSNSCYPSASPLTNFSCTQDGGTCSGSSDTSVTWTCTFALWYNADPTDSSTQFTAQNWLASIEATDDDAAASALTESSTGNELVSFLAFDVSSTSIPYGDLEPGTDTGTLGTTTDLIAQGNVGLDEDLYGDTMCPTWSSPDSCDSDGFQAGNDIPVSNHQFATSSVAYSGVGAYTLTSSSSPAELLINVPKTTSTSSPAVGYTYWGLAVPGAITTAGNYTGQNTITAKKSDPSNW